MNMSARILILIVLSVGTLLFAGNQQSKEQADMTTDRHSQTELHTHKHATAKITVQNSQAKPYDQTSPALMELHLSETFTGDIEVESPVRALQDQRGEKSASQVSMQ